MIIKPTRILENKEQLLEMADLLVDLRNTFDLKHKDADPNLCQWAIEQAIMRLSIKDGHDFGNPV